MKLQSYRIHAEPNVIDDHLIDIIARGFNFDHPKGLSEWLKNAADAYIRNGQPDSEQFVIFRFTDDPAGGQATLECIDFNGMDRADIEGAFKRWGDPNAANRGLQNKVYGGHGNGGKYYMRQMFANSYFITYKKGLLNVFGFNSERRYGFAEGYKDKPMEAVAALEYAGLKDLRLPEGVRQAIVDGKTGFTVVRGVTPNTMPKVIKLNYIAAGLAAHPQSQRILNHIPVSVIHNGSVVVSRLTPEKLEPKPDFEELPPIPIPHTLLDTSHYGRAEVVMDNESHPQGYLQLRTSAIAMVRGTKYADFNRVDIIGELGVIASYKIQELESVRNYSQSAFIYGECECKILEDIKESAVHNERTKLLESPRTRALLNWIGEQIMALCSQIAEKESEDRQKISKDITSVFNSFLNQWKNKYMSKILAEILVPPGVGSGYGNVSEGRGGFAPPANNEPDEVVNPQPEVPKPNDQENGGGGTPSRGKTNPQVLTSGVDPDPFAQDGSTLVLSPRHPVVYQRPQDYDNGIYWINTSAPLAESIRKRYGENHPRWRDYLFQRYMDIFIKIALFELQKKEPDNFNSDTVESRINDVVSKFHEAASEDLSTFLFDDNFNPEVR